MGNLKWHNVSKDNPGFSVYHASPTRNPDVLYVIRQKRKTDDFTPVGWRLFVRPKPGIPLATIYMADTLKEAKEFADHWEEIASTSGEQ
ncbi:hypothetical protein SEA_REINDEER_5 [Mycobacterium phage Reindeer]|uniref:Uncharacterized protein n=1 Tax=Mycobacterium phage Reindeer TaxID=2762283 RepID=A0A7G8LHU3_9CAUD|nr:hypothetical protein J4U05_gp005 [Mycobacterium phage Reindeer]QNJ56815.1 hypothetical protein SEA_REINDEER_5 [Mycobacterium phage Reindeer]